MANPREVAFRTVPPISGLVEEVGFGTGHVLYEVQLKAQDDGWLAVLKAQSPKALLVAFVGAGTYPELLERIAERSSEGGFTWSVDKYPPRTRLRQLGFDV